MHFEFETSTTDASDFFLFVVSLIAKGVFNRGDYLLLDNASIHFESGTGPIIADMLNAMGVQMLFLPKYSPEYNPIELVFAEVTSNNLSPVMYCIASTETNSFSCR